MDLQLTPEKKEKKDKGQSLLHLRRSRIRKALLFLSFLIASLGMWLVQSLQTTYTTQVSIPIEYQKWNKDYGMDDALPREIQVTLSDKGFRLLNYTFGEIEPIQITPRKKIYGSRAKVQISSQQLTSLVRERLLSSSTIMALSPSDLAVSLYKRQKKEILVRSSVEIVPANGYVVSSISINPTRITIYGEDDVLRRIGQIATQAVQKSGVKSSDSIRVDLKLPPNIEAVPSSVMVAFTIEELSEETIEIPISAVNVPDGYELRPLPSVVSATLTLPKSQLGKLSAQNFRLAVDFSELYMLPENNREHLTVQVLEKPEGIARVQCVPSRVQFVLESK